MYSTGTSTRLLPQSADTATVRAVWQRQGEGRSAASPGGAGAGEGAGGRGPTPAPRLGHCPITQQALRSNGEFNHAATPLLVGAPWRTARRAGIRTDAAWTRPACRVDIFVSAREGAGGSDALPSPPPSAARLTPRPEARPRPRVRTGMGVATPDSARLRHSQTGAAQRQKYGRGQRWEAGRQSPVALAQWRELAVGSVTSSDEPPTVGGERPLRLGHTAQHAQRRQGRRGAAPLTNA